MKRKSSPKKSVSSSPASASGPEKTIAFEMVHIASPASLPKVLRAAKQSKDEKLNDEKLNGGTLNDESLDVEAVASVIAKMIYDQMKSRNEKTLKNQNGHQNVRDSL